jgi:hypothetical protein
MIEQTLNAMRCLELLQNELFTTLVDFEFDLDEVIFQQVNALANSIRIVQE